MRLVQLTTEFNDDGDEKPVWVNPAHVTDVTFSDENEYTLVTFVGGRTISISETVETVVRLLVG